MLTLVRCFIVMESSNFAFSPSFTVSGELGACKSVNCKRRPLCMRFPSEELATRTISKRKPKAQILGLIHSLLFNCFI